MRLKSGGTHLGYHVHYGVDGGKVRIILQVLVTPSEVMDNQPMLDLLWRVRFRWKLRPRHVTGDTKYGTIQNIKAIEEAGIRAYVPLPDWEHMTPFFGPAKFTYHAAHDHYVCPLRLRLLWRVNIEAVRIAAGQNLKRLLTKRGWGRRPFPVEALCASFWGLWRDLLVLISREESFLVSIGSASSILRTPCVTLC